MLLPVFFSTVMNPAYHSCKRRPAPRTRYVHNTIVFRKPVNETKIRTHNLERSGRPEQDRAHRNPASPVDDPENAPIEKTIWCRDYQSKGSRLSAKDLPRMHPSCHAGPNYGKMDASRFHPRKRYLSYFLVLTLNSKKKKKGIQFNARVSNSTRLGIHVPANALLRRHLTGFLFHQSFSSIILSTVDCR